MIPFSIVFLWKNEKKQVTYAKVISMARKDCVTIESEAPADENDYRLVHCMGTTENAEPITDSTFGASVENSYRLVRTVEMYQWKTRKSLKWVKDVSFEVKRV